MQLLIRPLPAALAVAAAVAAGCGYGTPTNNEVTARTPVVTPIRAVLDEAAGTTTYTISVSASPAEPNFNWSGPGCGTTQQSRTAGQLPTGTYVWTHAGCSDAVRANTMIRAEVSAQDYAAICQYRGSASGNGEACGSEYDPGRY